MARIGKVQAVDGQNATVNYNDNLPYRRQGQFFNPPGFDSRPLEGDKVLSLDLGDRSNKVIVGGQNSQKSRAGESRIYARASEAEVYCDRDGNTRINGDIFHFVLYEMLAEKWVQLMEYLASNLPEPPPDDLADISNCSTTTVKTDG